MAGTSFFTLVAAVFAGVFAGSAAHWTKKQAEASDNQVRIAGEALSVAQQEAQAAHNVAEHQRHEADRAHRRLAEAQLDAIAPIVLAEAKQGQGNANDRQCLEVLKQGEGARDAYWETVSEQFELADNDHVVFRTNVVITLQNISDRAARIDIVDPSNGDTDVRPGTPIIVPPGEHRSIGWRRTLSAAALTSQEEIDNPKNWLFDLTLWVRDLGMNVRDVYKFNGDLRFFARDGSRLIVKPEPPFLWDEDVAVPLRGRIYERLEAGANPESRQTGQRL